MSRKRDGVFLVLCWTVWTQNNSKAMHRQAPAQRAHLLFWSSLERWCQGGKKERRWVVIPQKQPAWTTLHSRSQGWWIITGNSYKMVLSYKEESSDPPPGHIRETLALPQTHSLCSPIFSCTDTFKSLATLGLCFILSRHGRPGFGLPPFHCSAFHTPTHSLSLKLWRLLAFLPLGIQPDENRDYMGVPSSLCLLEGLVQNRQLTNIYSFSMCEWNLHLALIIEELAW